MDYFKQIASHLQSIVTSKILNVASHTSGFVQSNGLNLRLNLRAIISNMFHARFLVRIGQVLVLSNLKCVAKMDVPYNINLLLISFS